MLNVGIIKSDSSNNRLYYEVNQTYQHYKPLRAIFADDKLQSSVVDASTEGGDWLKRLKPLGAVKVAILSGSLVRGSKGDVDLLLAGNLNKTQVSKFVKELETEESKSLNYTVMSYEDFYYRLSIKDRFVTTLITSKKTILVDTEAILTK